MSFGDVEDEVGESNSLTPREYIGLGLMILLALLGVWFCWEELHYSVAGVTTKATVIENEVIEGTVRFRRKRYQDNMTRLVYEFVDNHGKTQTNELLVFPEHVKALCDADGKIDIIYLRGEPSQNTPVLMRHTSYAIGFCIVCGLALLIYAFYFFALRPGILEEQRRDALR